MAEYLCTNTTFLKFYISEEISKILMSKNYALS